MNLYCKMWTFNKSNVDSQVKQSIAAVEMQVWQSQSKGDDLFLGEVNIPLYSLVESVMTVVTLRNTLL